MSGESNSREHEFRSRIEAARAYGGFSSQAKLAKAIGMRPGTFQRRLSGEYAWRRADILAIAEACDVPVEFFERGFVAKLQGKELKITPKVQDQAYLISVGSFSDRPISPDKDDESELAEDLLDEGLDDDEGERGRA